MRPDDQAVARAAAESAARDAYGRLLGVLARRAGDLCAAEDALSTAFEAALSTWPDRGVPQSPQAWLLTTARRALIDADRKDAVRRRAVPALVQLAEEAGAPAPDWPDERLALMAACARPEIDPGLHAPLMLQVVLGLSAERIAAAFLVKPAAMGRRLSRAKARIRQEDLSFEPADPQALSTRLEPVLEAIYVAYGAGWEDAFEDGRTVRGLSEDAFFLARLTARLAPASGEAHALVALIAHCQARTAARRGPCGDFIALSEQDPALWNEPLMIQAENALRTALSYGPPGRFALEAAIQSVHAERRVTGRTNWPAAAALYDALLATGRAGLGAAVARACAHGQAFGAQAALTALDALDVEAGDHQPWHAARAHWLARTGDAPGARAAYDRAAALSADPAVRRFLQQKSAELDA